MKRFFGVAALAGLLVGCSGGSDGADADGDGSITQAEVAAEMADGPTVQMRAGQWETRIEYTELDLPGVPDEMKDMVARNIGSGIVTTQCLTDDDLNSADPEVFKTQQDAGCEYDEFDRSGNRMKIKMSCDIAGSGRSETALEGEFSEDSYTLDIEGSFAGGPGGDVNVKGRFSGKRIGDCG